MTLDRAQQIVAFYDLIEDGEPEISTERLLAMSASAAGCDVDDVIEALQVSGSAE
jgi:hypothetical protein